MTGLDMGAAVPDPSWTPAELLEQAEACTALTPAWLVPLTQLDAADLLPYDRLTLALVLQRMTAVTEAAALHALALVPDRRCVPDPALRGSHPSAAARMCPGGSTCHHHWECDEIAALTGLSRWATDHRRALAWHLVSDWAPLMPLLAGGRLSLPHLDKLWLATTNANPEAVAAAVQTVLEVIGKSPNVSVASLSRSARRAVARHTDPAEATRRQRDRVRDETGVTFEDIADGLAALTVTGETHKLEAVRAMIRDHFAATAIDPEDVRNQGQREVDLIVSLCLSPTGYSAGATTTESGRFTCEDGPRPTPGTAEGAAPRVGVIITTSLETLLGLSNEPGMVGDTLVGAGFIRAWAANPDWARRAVLDHHGRISSISRAQRFPTGLLAAAVRGRWARCTYPGCHRAASDAQLDHAEPHALGGLTTLENLHPLCLRHHRLKDQPGFHVRLTEDGTAVWTLPSGRKIAVRAPDHTIRPGPHDGRPDWAPEPPELPEDTLDDAWVARLIAHDPERRAA